MSSWAPGLRAISEGTRSERSVSQAQPELDSLFLRQELDLTGKAERQAKAAVPHDVDGKHQLSAEVDL